MLKEILLSCLLGATLAPAVSSGNLLKTPDVSSVMDADVVDVENEEDIYCKVTTDYMYWVNDHRIEQHTFKTEDEYFAWCGDANNFLNQFQQTYVYLYKDNAKVALFPSIEFKVYAQNHSFSFTDRYRNIQPKLDIAYVQYSREQITHLFIWDGTLSTTFFNISEFADVNFSNTKMYGSGMILGRSLFDIHPGGRLVLENNSVISNYYLFDNVGIVNLIEEYSYNGNVPGICGDKTSEFNNIKSNEDSIIRMDANGAFIDGVNFSQCSNGDDGGVIYTTSSGSITNCAFNSNYSGDEGGAIFVNSYMKISSCTFTNNSCDDDGGAIYVYEDNVEITGCTFTSNTSVTDGGAICIDADNVKVKSCNFYSNHALDDGGAIYVCVGAGDAYIGYCNFSGNWADDACDTIDDVSSTVIDHCGSLLSAGNIVIIIVSSVVLVAAAVFAIIYFTNKKRKNKQAKKA